MCGAVRLKARFAARLWRGSVQMATVAIPEKANSSLSACGSARSTVSRMSLNAEELRKIHAYWRACNYLTLGMIYLQDNPLLKEPLKSAHVKNRLLGHWGSRPGLVFIYLHLTRLNAPDH